MGDFWDDIKKKNEERRIAGIKSDIRVLEEQIKEYEDAKKKVESAKKKCNSECEEWKEKLGNPIETINISEKDIHDENLVIQLLKGKL